jgi:hypothetical protein
MDGLAVTLFYLIVAAVWVFIKITTRAQRQAMLEWSLIFVAVIGTAGFVYESYWT